MKYVLFICTDPTGEPYDEATDDIETWFTGLQEQGKHLVGDRLRPVEDASTVWVRGGERSVSDGPFAETREWIAGFDLIEAEHLVAEVTAHAAHGRRPVGRYTLQAAIALEHVRPDEPDGTDWVRLAHLHEVLNRLEDVPAQRLAWAVATGRAHGPQRGLDVLRGFAAGEDLHLFHAVRADLLEAAGEFAAAREAYARAAELAPGAAEREALLIEQEELRGRARKP